LLLALAQDLPKPTLAAPPTLDAGEIADKGSLSQRAALYDPESGAVITAP